MTSPGWYPDPAGAPKTFRYWDGFSWSQATSTDPFAQVQPPPPMPPPAPSPYGALPSAPPWSPMPGVPTPASAGGSHSGRNIAIATGGVAFLVLLGVIALIGVRTLGDNSASPRPPIATASPVQPTLPGTIPTVPPAPLGTITPTAMQCQGGNPLMTSTGKGATISSGGVVAPSLRDHGYRPDLLNALAFSLTDNPAVMTKQVARNWLSFVMTASLRKANGFKTAEASARTVIACLANDPRMYAGAYSITDISAKAITVDGHPAYSLVQNVKVHETSTPEPGDTVQVIVVNTGNARSYGLFVMAVPIGDKPLLALQKSTAAQLRVK